MNRIQKSSILTGFAIGFTSIFLLTVGNNAFALEYNNEQCGVSIQYPEGWKVENDDYKTEELRSFATIFPDPDEYSNQASIKIWDISDYSEKTIEYLSEIFAPPDSGGGIEITTLRNDITQLGDFPAQITAYGEEFKGSKIYIMDVNILAYDKLYQISLETEDQGQFDEYSPLVEEMANTIQISEPNFEGVNC